MAGRNEMLATLMVVTSLAGGALAQDAGPRRSQLEEVSGNPTIQSAPCPPGYIRVETLAASDGDELSDGEELLITGTNAVPQPATEDHGGSVEHEYEYDIIARRSDDDANHQAEARPLPAVSDDDGLLDGEEVEATPSFPAGKLDTVPEGCVPDPNADAEPPRPQRAMRGRGPG
jgi:hypothetical protein